MFCKNNCFCYHLLPSQHKKTGTHGTIANTRFFYFCSRCSRCYQYFMSYIMEYIYLYVSSIYISRIYSSVNFTGNTGNTGNIKSKTIYGKSSISSSISKVLLPSTSDRIQTVFRTCPAILAFLVLRSPSVISMF